MTLEASHLSRREFLKGSGALIVGFSLFGTMARQAIAADNPYARNSPPDAGQIDSWIVIHEDTTGSILTGHQELGTGTSTGLLMIAGEELDLDVTQLRFVTEDTDGRTPASWPSYTSEGITGCGPEVRAAAAAAKQVLLQRASERLRVPVERLTVNYGTVSAHGGRQSVTYGQLLGGKRFHTTIPKIYNLTEAKMPGFGGSAGVLSGAPGTKPVKKYKLVGKRRIPRIDVPAKAKGTYHYLHNVRLPGMLHGRVVLPTGQGMYGARVRVLSVNETSIAHIDGARVVRRGDFVGVVAPREWDAVRAAEALQVKWAKTPALPGDEALFEHMRRLDDHGKANVQRTVDTGHIDAALARSAHVVKRTYRYPFNAHVPIGPACAVADVKHSHALVYSNSQDLWQLQSRLAAVLELPKDTIRVHWVEGSGSYGGSPCRFEAPEAAAIMSQIVGKPVRVQFMRANEHGWDNYGPPQLIDIQAGVDGRGRITALDYTITQLPFPIGTYSMEELVGLPYAKQQEWAPSTDVTGSQYTIPHWRLTARTLPNLRSGFLKADFLRSPIAHGAAFAVEQAIDELAHIAGMDPVEFRRQNVQRRNKHPQANFLWLGFYDYSKVASNKERWLGVLDGVAEAARWKPRVAASAVSGGKVLRGRGIGLGGCGNGAYSVSYAAAVAEIEVHKTTGKIVVKHVYTCQDYGLVIDRGLVENQATGMTIQAISRVLKEEVKFDEQGVTSTDWSSYPILRFKEAPKVTNITISRPEITPGPGSEELIPPVMAAVANAFFDATGVRMTRAPLTPARVRAALKAPGIS